MSVIILFNTISPILLLIVEFFIYKNKFNKFAKSDTPSNLKLGIDIIALAVLGFLSTMLLIFILGLLVMILPIAGIIGKLTPIIVLIIYYYILKYLASRHTKKENAKQVADQTLVFTILFGILYYLIYFFFIIPLIAKDVMTIM